MKSGILSEFHKEEAGIKTPTPGDFSFVRENIKENLVEEEC